MKNEAIEQYLKEINRAYSQGDATEHTHRPALKKLIEALGDKITAINEPARMTEVGAPDMRISKKIRNIDLAFGYIECKNIGKNLKKEEKSEQLKRYLKCLDCLILTDYLSFRLYRGGNLEQTAELAEEGKGGKFETSPGRISDVKKLLAAFFMAEPIRAAGARELAEKMAGIAQNLRYAIGKTFDREAHQGTLHGQFEAFKKVLLHDLNEEDFADMYAQTICYGLFTARYYKTGQEPFTRLDAPKWLPKTNPFLRKTFGHIAGHDLDERIAWIVDGLAVLLDFVQMDKIRRDFGHKEGKQDPVVHFYETFLAAYDPRLRESRGVYYTPEPVVSYIVRSVDWLLKEKFGLRQGLKDSAKINIQKDTAAEQIHRCLILDPAVGTGTFLYEVIRLIRKGFKDKGAWSSYVKDHLLPRLFGFELMMAPYAVCHMKLGLELAETGYDFAGDERLGVYLTNTLEEAEEISGMLPFGQWISEEAKEANKVKRDLPIMVVLGNPPYSGHSANASWTTKDGKKVKTFIGNLIDEYYFVDGKPLGEKNPKWLQDDYVKFIRYGQYRIQKNGCGILAFITNHGYLDNPTFRGMRQQLMKTFSEIYILDLHGNSKKKEVCPDGSPDKNVFDIQQGVSIGIFVKEPDRKEEAKVYHAELWGERKNKYDWLEEHEITKTKWKTVKPGQPFYLFSPQDIEVVKEYNSYEKITEIIPVNVLGFQTHRDDLAIDYEEGNIKNRIKDFIDNKLPDTELIRKYTIKESSAWTVSKARKEIRQLDDWKKSILKCAYRPFDERYCYFDSSLMDRPRRELLDHVAWKENLCLLSSRQQGTFGYRHCYIAKKPANDCVVSNISREANQVFPLYLYPTGKKKDLFEDEGGDWPPGKDGRIPNLDKGFVEELSGKIVLSFVSDGRGDLKKTFGPEDVFDYIYGVFHSPQYRQRYAEFLKIDFPRVPWPKDRQRFIDIARVGGKLVKLHLMEAEGLEENGPRFPVEGDMEVAKGHPRYDGGQVYINPKQYFEGVPEDVWQFRIGGYQVCEKWLKDRRERKLSYDDIRHYQKITLALAETIRLMADPRLKFF